MKNRKIKIGLLTLSLVAWLTGCGGDDTENKTNTGGNSSEVTKTKYNVKFANTSMQDEKVEEGGKLSKPSDPTKANNVFVGWYEDSEMKKLVSFPLTINSDTTIYAKFYSYQDAFKNARANTIGDSVPGYEYDYTLEVTAGYMGLSLKGNTSGNTKYSKSSNDVSFYDAHTNSGALFYDGTKYSIKKGTDLHTFSLDQNDKVKSYKIEKNFDKNYDSSSFAKAVFEYDDSKLKEISPTSTSNEYSLKTGFNASAGISLIGNYLNHPMVEKIVGELPETSVNTGMYVTFSNDKLATYRYEMGINVTGIQFTLKYNLTFKNIGSAPSIAPKVVNNVYISDSDSSKIKSEINAALNSFKNQTTSSYDFTVKTAVDFPNKNAINATVDGFTKRKVSSGTVYYLNDYEVDTDHKNADLYKAKGLEDCHGGKVKLSNGEVHNLKKKLLGGYSDLGITTGKATDDYYLLDIINTTDFTFIQKIENTSKKTVTYNTDVNLDFGNNSTSLINKINNVLDLNPLEDCSCDVSAFGNIVSGTRKESSIQIIVKDGALSEISFAANGKIKTSFPNSRDFTNAEDASFKVELTIKVTDDAKGFAPADDVSKIGKTSSSQESTTITTLDAMCSYLEQTDAVSGGKTVMDASYIGAVSGIRYDDFGVEIYMFSGNAPASFSLLGSPMEFDAVNGKFALLFSMGSNKNTSVINAFNNAKTK